MKFLVNPLSAKEPILVMHRTFDAPRELVWAVLTDPKYVVKWYGGRGFENPVCEMDVRPGGRWRHVMRTPDGSAHELEFVFVEVVRPERLVWRSAGASARPEAGYRNNVMTVTLEAAGARTEWTLVARFASMAERDGAAGIGFTTVLGEGTDKFAEILATLAGAAGGSPAARSRGA